MYRLVTIQTRGVTCIIYRARGESCWRMCVHLYGIEPGIGGLRITGSNVDTLLADYRAALKQFSTATLRLSLSLSLSLSTPFPFCSPAFFRRPDLPGFFFFFQSLPRFSFLCTRLYQSAGSIGECFHPDESSHPEARKKIGLNFVPF